MRGKKLRKIKKICVLRREWKEKQIINFGISFQLKVASTTRKKKNQQRTKAMSLVESAGAARRYAKRFFSIRKEAAAARRSRHLLFHFFKFFCCAKLSCPIDDRTVSIQRLRQAITRKLWEDRCCRRCEASFAKHLRQILFLCFIVFGSFALLDDSCSERFCFLEALHDMTIKKFCGMIHWQCECSERDEFLWEVKVAGLAWITSNMNNQGWQRPWRTQPSSSCYMQRPITPLTQNSMKIFISDSLK